MRYSKQLFSFITLFFLLARIINILDATETSKKPNNIVIMTDDVKGYAQDPLPSWNEGRAKTAILQFIKATTEPGPNLIPVEDRIAAFDQDGTLWVEQPLYTEIFYTIEAIKSMLPEHPEWQHNDHIRAILAGNLEALQHLSKEQKTEFLARTHSGMSVDSFHRDVQRWLEKAIHPKYKRPFTELVYQPMLEVIQLFRDKGFQIYIVSGGGQEFIRSFAKKLYGIPPERVIGSAGKVEYVYRNGQPALIKLPHILFVNDKEGKPEGINLIIGKRPVAAFGNSIGDQQMLEWTQAGNTKNLALLVYHDDAEREYAYGPHSKIGTFSDALMAEAKGHDWIVVSMKNDWKIIFPWEKIDSNIPEKEDVQVPEYQMSGKNE